MSATTASRPRRFDREVDGILLLDKPVGLSSNAALQEARRIYRALKAGHAGSLDPLASGLLPVCFGQATKVCGQLLESGKRYRVTARLGLRTDTADAEGRIIEERPVPELAAAEVTHVLESFLGERTQIPPMYSALKVAGQPLYKLARKGQSVERAPRRIRIDEIRLLRCEVPELEIEVACSKGTYIRVLVEDIAQALATVGHVAALRRTRVDAFGDAPMVTLAQLKMLAEAGDADSLAAHLLPLDCVFTSLPSECVDEAGEDHLLHGRPARPVGSLAAGSGETVRVYGPGRRFLGLAERQADGTLRVRRLFVRSAGGHAPDLR